MVLLSMSICHLFVGFFCIRPGVWFQILLLLSLVYFAYRWIQHALLKGDQPCLYVSGFMQPMLLRIIPVTVVVVSGQYIALLMAASFAIWNNVSYWLLSKIVYRCMYSKVNNRLWTWKEHTLALTKQDELFLFMKLLNLSQSQWPVIILKW